MNPRSSDTPLPYISTRKYIKWGDNPPGENTDTLVLTTPQKHYTDVRIFLPLPRPSTPDPPFPLSSLEWGFAGTSVSTPATNDTPQHTVWTHWVDSKHPLGTEVQDEGDMHPQATGETLEYGEMVNPSTGKLEKYEECWVDIDIDFDAEGKGIGKKGWVIKSEGGGWRGMIARIGDHIQSVIKKGDDVGVERWLWSVERGCWLSVVKIGEVGIDGKDLFEQEGTFKLGDSFLGKEVADEASLEWKVVEVFEWD